MAYQIVPILMTLHDLQRHSHIARGPWLMQLCSSSQDFSWHSAFCSPSVRAQFLVMVMLCQWTYWLHTISLCHAAWWAVTVVRMVTSSVHTGRTNNDLSSAGDYTTSVDVLTYLLLLGILCIYDNW